MKLKLTQIKIVHDSLVALDGYDKSVSIDGKDKVIKQPYDLSGKVRWNIAKNIRILTDKLDGFTKVRNDLISQISGGTNEIKPDDKEKLAEFLKNINEVMEAEEDVEGLLLISQADLKLDSDLSVNPIPASVINGLGLILK